MEDGKKPSKSSLDDIIQSCVNNTLDKEGDYADCLAEFKRRIKSPIMARNYQSALRAHYDFMNGEKLFDFDTRYQEDNNTYTQLYCDFVDKFVHQCYIGIYNYKKIIKKYNTLFLICIFF